MERVFSIHVDDVVKLVCVQREVGNHAQALAILRALHPVSNADLFPGLRPADHARLVACCDRGGQAR